MALATSPPSTAPLLCSRLPRSQQRPPCRGLFLPPPLRRRCPANKLSMKPPTRRSNKAWGHGIYRPPTSRRRRVLNLPQTHLMAEAAGRQPVALRAARQVRPQVRHPVRLVRLVVCQPRARRCSRWSDWRRTGWPSCGRSRRCGRWRRLASRLSARPRQTSIRCVPCARISRRG